VSRTKRGSKALGAAGQLPRTRSGKAQTGLKTFSGKINGCQGGRSRDTERGKGEEGRLDASRGPTSSKTKLSPPGLKDHRHPHLPAKESFTHVF